MADGCAAVLRLQTLIDPPEYCENEAIEGSDYCEDHEDLAYPDDRDDDYKERLEAWDEHDDRL